LRERSGLADKIKGVKNPAQEGLEILLFETVPESDSADLNSNSDDTNSDNRSLEGLKARHNLTQLINFSRPSYGYGTKGTERSNYNLRNLFYTNEDNQTIEFREHESTLSPDRVGNWIGFCVGLIEFSDSGDWRGKESLLKQHINDKPGQFTTEQMLLALDLPTQAEFYGR
jgi:hypothetical protein